MKTLYIQCEMGAAGDMLLAALLELLPDPDAFIAELNALGIPGVEISREESVKCGITGTHVRVLVHGAEEESHDHGHPHVHEEGGPCHEHGHDHGHEHTHGQEQGAHAHSHTGIQEIWDLLEGLPLSGRVKADAMAVYGLVAGAEAVVHGKPVSQVHFHEVGSMDAVADVVGVSLALEKLGADRIVASPIHVGSGQVRCAHGVLPVPAPATACILQGIPTYGGEIRGELCTPTGAALLRHFAGSFGPMPVMAVQAVGYGMGKKDFAAANCVRVFLGEAAEAGAAASERAQSVDDTPTDVVELCCNLDDMTGEELAFAAETLLENGALDVWLTPVQMKKGRPGQLLSCLCVPEKEGGMARLLLRHTTTLGVRSRAWKRHTLTRRTEIRQTALGKVHVKVSEGEGAAKQKAEYEDLARIAREKGMSLADVKRELGEL